jgi:hypothetical protein
VAEATSPRPGRGPGGERLGGAPRGIGGTAATGSTDASFDGFVDEVRIDHAGASRRREAWLRRQAADDATVAGTLVSLAERGASVSVTTCSGNRHVGRLRGAGADLVLVDVHGARVAITVDAVDSFSAHADHPVDARRLAAFGHRSGADATTLLDLLALVVADRPDVTLVTRSGLRQTGELVAAGADVVMLRPTDGGALSYTPVASLSEVLLPASTGSG